MSRSRSKLKMILITGMVSFVVAHSSSYANTSTVSLLELKLPDLQADQSVAISGYLKGNSESFILLSFFSPECSWCHRQMKAFNKLEASCDETIVPIMVGINGNPRELRAELRRAKVSFPALKATPVFMKGLDIEATPWTLLLDGNGQLLANLRGYLSFDELVEIFADQCTAGTKQ